MFSYFSYGWEPILSPNKVETEWKTLTRQCLSPTEIQKYHSDPSRLIGLRHDRWTQYCVIDIDHASCYRDEDSIRALCDCLSDIGLEFPIFLQSSYKGKFNKGKHIFFFLENEVNTRNLADLICDWLNLNGFVIRDGNLEVFPTPGNGTDCKFKAIRLPLQPDSGSWILDDNFIPYNNTIECLTKLISLNLNTPDFSKLEIDEEPAEIVPSQKADDWQKGVKAMFRRGWTSPGQTQSLIRAAIDEVVVFRKMTEVNLVCKEVKLILINLPGYTKYCGHQHDIDKQIESWVTANLEKGVRMPYRGHPRNKSKGKDLLKSNCQRNDNITNLNKAKNTDTLERLIGCVDWLVENGETDFNTLRSFRTRANEVSIEIYGVGISPKIIQQHKLIWQDRIHVISKFTSTI
jgi:hypothetical protein